MEFTFGSFRLDIDTTGTRELYENAPLITDTCSCDGCRNYAEAAKLFPQEVKSFFRTLGMDVQKAAEVYLWDSQSRGKEAAYGGFYHLCGRILDCPQDAGEWYTVADGFRVQFTDDISLAEEGLKAPAIQMEIDFTRVPYLV